jgi:hypothetical protein
MLVLKHGKELHTKPPSIKSSDMPLNNRSVDESPGKGI